MSEEVLESKLQKIREIGENHAKAKAELSRLEHGRKILLAVLMKKFMINSNTGKLDSAVAQDREARASDEYKAHIDELAKAVKEEAKWNWEKKLVEMNFEKWKTETISQMKEYKNYGNKI